MGETKSELKVIYICVAVVAAQALGLDLDTIGGMLGNKVVLNSAGDAVTAGKNVAAVAQSGSKDLAFYVTALGGLYTAGRSLVKAVRDNGAAKVKVAEEANKPPEVVNG